MRWTGVLAGLLAAQFAAADAAHVDFELGIVFPQELAGMPLDQVEKYNAAELGYSLFYSDGDFSCEVSVFDLGRSDIPDGPSSDGLQTIIQSMELEMEKLDKQGDIDKFQKRGGPVVPKTSPLQFSNTVFKYSEPREVDGKRKMIPRYNSIYLTGSHGKFIKVQFKFDAAGNSRARGMADELVKQLVVGLVTERSEDDLLLAACDALIHNPAGYSGQMAAQRIYEKTMTMDELSIYDAFFVWPQDYSKPDNADLLTVAYFAGMLKVVIPQQLASG
ncbi:hypothetical protein, partial [Pontiella sp.]|uniref:hypothetical protein n=1 Tax=Pontiella sp. TaxID=2837462 RepID=UPI003569C6DD